MRFSSLLADFGQKKKDMHLNVDFFPNGLGESCKVYICLAEGDYAFCGHSLKNRC